MSSPTTLAAELHHLGHALARFRRTVKVQSEYSSLSELSPTDTGAIDIIGQKPSISVGELTERLLVPKSTATSLLDRLERKGFIVRALSSSDRRSFEVQLTELGKKAFEQHAAFEERAWEKAISALSAEEQEQFVSLFRKVVKGLKESP